MVKAPSLILSSQNLSKNLSNILDADINFWRLRNIFTLPFDPGLKYAKHKV